MTLTTNDLMHAGLSGNLTCGTVGLWSAFLTEYNVINDINVVICTSRSWSATTFLSLNSIENRD